MCSRKIIYLTLLPALLLAIGCGRHDGTGNITNKSLLQIDSLTSLHSSDTRSMIEKGMREASDSMSWFEYYARLAKYYSLSPTPDSLLPVVRKVEGYASRHDDSERGRQLLAYALNTHANYYHNFHRHTDEAISLYTRAYNLLMASDDKSQAPKIAANLGDAFTYENNLPEAAKCYRRALFLVDSLRLPQEENVTLYLGLANIYQQLGDEQNALHLYQATEKQAATMSVNMQAYFLNNYGCYYYYLKDYRKALQKFLALRKLLETKGMDKNFDMYLCKLNLADVYLNLDSLGEATSNLDEVEPFMNRHGDEVSQYYCHTIRIGIAVKQRRWADVRRYDAIDGARTDIPFSIRDIRSRYMCGYYVGIGDYAQAYNDLLADEAYNDSLDHNRTNMRAADIMAQFAADTIRLHADVMREQQHAKVVRGRTFGVLTLGITIILALILVAMTQRSRKLLVEARMRIMDLRLSSARSKISPHFVFNVLNNHLITSEEEDDGTLQNLTKLIRQNLDLSRKLVVPLEDELSFVEHYVEAEKPMVGDDFDFLVSVSPEIDPKQRLVPSMLVQIMVENAIVHALSGWDGHKLLHVDAVKLPDAVTIRVTDNGPGFNTNIIKNKGRTGFNIIRETIAVINSRNRQKITFDVKNLTGDDGKVKGCQESVTIPDKLRFKSNKF